MSATKRIRLGMLTPSSNTVLEPASSAMLAALPGVTAHFARFRVVRIALAADAAAQFDTGPMLAVAALLADARVDAIAWNGTSGGWLGSDADRRLCRAIAERTGVPATSATLALLAALAASGRRRLGLVSPYTRDVQQAIVRTFAAEGIDVVAERHLGIADNFAFGGVPAADIDRMVDAVVADGAPDAVTAFCTNLAAAALGPAWERRHGVLALDSVAVTVWHALGLAGVDTAGLAGWGGLFRLRPPADGRDRAGAVDRGGQA